MKTTLIIDDRVFARLKAKAAQENRTVSSLVEAALRVFLEHRPPVKEVSSLPTFNSGGALVDIADREALYQAMDEGS